MSAAIRKCNNCVHWPWKIKLKLALDLSIGTPARLYLSEVLPSYYGIDFYNIKHSEIYVLRVIAKTENLNTKIIEDELGDLFTIENIPWMNTVSTDKICEFIEQTKLESVEKIINFLKENLSHVQMTKEAQNFFKELNVYPLIVVEIYC